MEPPNIFYKLQEVLPKLFSGMTALPRLNYFRYGSSRLKDILPSLFLHSWSVQMHDRAKRQPMRG